MVEPNDKGNSCVVGNVDDVRDCSDFNQKTTCAHHQQMPQDGGVALER